MTASFGTAAPLPGQPGFRARPSESMARETAEMEERLARLKTDLAAEAEMREATGPRVGGSRWRSARTDRGSVRAYAKDVKFRHKQQLQQRPPHGIFATGGGRAGFGGGKGQPQAGAGARAAAALRDEQQKRQHKHKQQHHLQQQPQAATSKGGDEPTVSASIARPTFERKEVSQWGVGDTVEWLQGLGLGQHTGVFQQNEISGPILLEVGLDDLDYMDVRVLAHRKRILKGIEDLRRGGGRSCSVDTPPPPAPIPPSLPKASSPSGSGRRTDGAGNEAGVISTQQSGTGREGGDHRSSPVRRKQHWSTVKPLAENQTKGDPKDSRVSSVNLADGHYDEVAARSSFADAVAEWRGEGRNSTAKEATPPSLHRPSVVGRAPLAGMPAERPEEETKEGQRPSRGVKRGLLGGGDGSGGAKECWTNPFSTPRVSENGAAAVEEPDLADLEPKTIFLSPGRTKTAIVVDASQQETPGVGENNGASTLDEQAEHEAFRRAVAEWNRGGRENSTAERKRGGSSEGGVVSSNPDEPSGATTGTATLPSRRTTEAMAQELREQMDAEHRLQAKELEEKKRALLEGLEKAAAEGSAPKTGLQQEEDHASGVRGTREFFSQGGERSLGDSVGVAFEGDGVEQGQQLDEEGDDRSAGSSTTPSSYSGATYRAEVHEDDEDRLGEGGCGFEQGGCGGGVEIEMMESVLGADRSAEDGKSYVVDEAESGEECC